MNPNYDCENLAECACGCGPWCRLKGQFDENNNYIEFDCKDCTDFVCDETLVSQDPNPSSDDLLDPDEDDTFFDEICGGE